MFDLKAHLDDARSKKTELRCPSCKRLIKRIHTTNVATDVLRVSCPNTWEQCGARWQVVIRPLKATREMVIRQEEWTELLPRRPKP